MGTKHHSRGHLDAVALRCLSHGTNAYTATDHTVYTIDTLSEDGITAMLPMYLEHVLRPSLLPSDFRTEVQHFTSRGTHGGVVYSEMLNRENSETDLAQNALHRLLYPRSRYIYDSGGRTKDLATLSVRDVRRYHRQHYYPQNLIFVFVGQFRNRESILGHIDKYFDFLCGMQSPGYRTVAGRTVNPESFNTIHDFGNRLKRAVTRRRRILFPSTDLSSSTVYLAWRLPQCHRKDPALSLAINVLIEYINGHNASPCHQAFVECDPPWATSVSFDVILRQESSIVVCFQGVQRKCKFEEFWNKFEEVFHQIHRDLEGNSSCVLRELSRQVEKSYDDAQYGYEEEPLEHISSHLLHELVYHPSHPQTCVKDVLSGAVTTCKQFSAPQWLSTFETYFMKATCHHVEIHMIPSRRATKNKEKCSKRLQGLLQHSISRSGHRSLMRHYQQRVLLRKNIELCKNVFHDHPAMLSSSVSLLPHEVIVEYLHFSRRKKMQCKKSLAMPDTDLCTKLQCLTVVPCTEFVSVHAFYDVSEVPHTPQLIQYLAMMGDLLFESDMSPDMSYAQVAFDLHHEIQSYSCYFGIGPNRYFSAGAAPHLFCIELTVRQEAVPSLLKWFENVTQKVKFTAARVQVIAHRLFVAIQESRREKSFVESQLALLLKASKDNFLLYYLSSFHLECFLQRIRKVCTNDDVEALSKVYERVLVKQSPCYILVTSPGHESSARIAKDVWKIASQMQEMEYSLKQANESSDSTVDSDEWQRQVLVKKSVTLHRKVITTATLDSRKERTSEILADDENIVKRNNSFLNDLICNWAGKCLLTGVDEADGADVRIIVPLRIDSSEDFIATSFVCHALSTMDGPLQTSVRDAGYAYGAYARIDKYYELLTVKAHDCTDPVKALKSMLLPIERALEHVKDRKVTNIHLREGTTALPDWLSGDKYTNAMCSFRYSACSSWATVSDVRSSALSHCLGLLPQTYYETAKQMAAPEIWRRAAPQLSQVLQVSARYILCVCKTAELELLGEGFKKLLGPGTLVKNVRYDSLRNYLKSS